MRTQAEIDAELKAALKAKDALRVGTLRLLKSELKNREIELRGPLDEAEFHKLLRSMLKQRRESLDAYRAAGRDDLAAQEAGEIAVLQEYLPPELDDAAIDAKIAELRATLPPEQAAQYGTVMGAVMKALGAAADGKRVAARVKAALEA